MASSARNGVFVVVKIILLRKTSIPLQKRKLAGRSLLTADPIINLLKNLSHQIPKSKKKTKKLVNSDKELDSKIKKLEQQKKEELKSIKGRPSPMAGFNDLYERYGDKPWMVRPKKKYQDFLDKENAINEKYSKLIWDTKQETGKENNRLIKEVFNDLSVRESAQKLHKLGTETYNLKKSMLGEDSEACKKAFAEWDKAGGDEYGFYHYQWRPGGKAYDKAYSEYKQKSSELNKQRTELSKQIGKQICGDLYDLPYDKKSGQTYKDRANELIETATDYMSYEDLFGKK